MGIDAYLLRYRILGVFSLFYLVISAVLRAVLWGRFGRKEEVNALQLAASLGVGVLSDLVQLVYLLALFVVYLALLPERLYLSRMHRRLAAAVFFCAIFGTLYLCAVEFYFFEEFDARFNLVAVDYLIYPHEVFVNLWESYPVVWVLLGTLILSVLFFRKLWAEASRSIDKPCIFRERAGFMTLHIVLLCALAFGFESDRIEFSENRVANEIGANGLNSLFRAFRTQDLAYDLYYRMLDKERAYSKVREELVRGGGEFISADIENLNRRFAARPDGLAARGIKHVVVIMIESLGAQYVGLYGDKRGLTPFLDEFASQCLVFKHVYASGTRTVRGLEAVVASFPPIPSESIIKRPGCEGIANWGRVMQGLGYNTSFIYGGFGRFDNMNHFFKSNGFTIIDRTDMREVKFANIWGVSDEDLYLHALEYFDQEALRGKPFFSIMLTTSNHKPYTFPEGIPGVKPKGGGRDAGVKYTDYALSRLFADAAQRDWFKHTLFVIVADHDSRVYGRQHIPMERYTIPLLICAPGRLKPGVVEKPISQIDIAPTVMGLLGLAYTAPFYGQDALFDPEYRSPLLINHNHNVALYRDGKLVVLGLHRKARTFYYDPLSNQQTPAPDDEAMLDLATAYYQTAYELFSTRRYQ